MHFGTEVFRWGIAVIATLRGVNKMLSIGWLLHQTSHAFDDISTPVFHWALVIDMPSHILESVQFPLPEILIIWHASHECLDAIPMFEAWETQDGVFFPQHVVIVRLHALLLVSTLDRFVLLTRHKQVVGIVLKVHLKATLSVAFPWLSNVIAEPSTGTGECFGPRRMRCWWLGLPVCDVVKVFEVGKRVLVIE